MRTKIAGGNRKKLLYFQRLVLLSEARELVERLTKLQEDAILSGLPARLIFRLDTIRANATERAKQRASDLASHHSSKATKARGGSRHH